MYRTCAAAAFLLAFCLSAAASDWPRLLGPAGTGFSDETGINKDWAKKKPALLWKVPLSDDGYAGPSVADGKVFIMDHKGADDVVRAFNLVTGKQTWEFSYPDTKENVHGFSRGTPAFDNGKLYTCSRNGVLNCLNAADGKKTWSRDLVTELKGVPPKWMMAASPLIDGDRVLVSAGGATATIVALNKATGEIIFNAGNGDACGYTSIAPATVVAGKKVYLVYTGQNLLGCDAANGRIIWSAPWENNRKINAAMPIITGDGTIFITSNYGLGSALVRVTDGKAGIAWKNTGLHARFNTPLLHGGHIYGIGEGYMVCINPADGKTTWKQGGFESGGLVGIEDVALAFDGKGGDLVLVKLEPEAYTELGRFTPLGGQSWTAPIIAHGKLIVRNKAQMACFDLK